MSRKKNQPEPLDALLSRLNRDIEGFIRGAIETPLDVKKWSFLTGGFGPVKCWELTGCKKKACPAYERADERCWLRVGTLCGGKVQGEFAKKYKTCFECDVLKKVSHTPVRLLYENINTLIFHLKDKALRLHELAIKDPLTDLYNRHFFNEIIVREAARSERNRETLSFIMIDMDNLKLINDTLGHLAGDEVLAETARLITNAVRKSDVVFRFGGDEFLVLMENADCEKAAAMSERLLAAARKWNAAHAAARGYLLSFSMGCSTREKGRDILASLKEADERMYRNKKERRNRRATDPSSAQADLPGRSVKRP